MDSRLARERLPTAFHSLVPLLSAESEGVRFGAEQALKRLLTVCFTDKLVAAAATQLQAGRAGPLPAAAAVVAAVSGALGPSAPQAWPSALSGKFSFDTFLCIRFGTAQGSGRYSLIADTQGTQPVSHAQELHFSSDDLSTLCSQRQPL